MNRFTLATLSTLALFACGGGSKPSIQVFSAAPGTIATGESTQLIFSASGTTLTIDPDVGDVTGKTSVNVTPSTTTTYTLTAKKDSSTVTSTATVTVNAPQARGFLVTRTGNPLVAGTAGTFTVTSVNGSGTIQPAYRGTVHLTVDDAGATVPADYTFTAADAGKHDFAVTFKAAGSRALIATDTAAASAQGVARVDVSPAPASQLVLGGVPAAANAGDVIVASVTARDPFGNVATGYRGIVHFSSPDTSAVLPANTAFTAADAGVRSFSLSLHTASATSVTVTDTPGSLTATSSVAMHWGPAAKFGLTGLATDTTADAATVVTITVSDLYGNVVKDYAGTVHLTTTDGAAAAMADVAFTAANQGVKTATVTFATAGTQSLTGQDSANAALQGSASTNVKHGGAANYVLSTLPSAAIAGQPLALTITAVDAHGNTVKAYTGTAHLSSTDGTDRLPADGTFTNGVRVVSLAFTKTGSHTAKVSELGGSINVNTSSVSISPAAAASLTLTSGSAVAGVAVTTTATVKDAYGNLALGYTGTVAFSSSDAQAVLPAATPFTSGNGGVRSFSVTLKTAGAQTITATDASNGLSGSATFAVSPGSGTAMVLTGAPSSVVAGAAFSLTVAVRDGFGNLAPGYTGTVRLSSTDTAAALGADYTFTAADAGQHNFSVALTTAGSATVTATDTVTASLTATSGSIAVTAAAAARIAISGLPSTAGADEALTATATVKDAFGNTVTTYAGTLHFVLTDATAPAIADQTLTAAALGTVSVPVTFYASGPQSLMVSDAANPAINGSAVVNVHNEAAVAYVLSALPSSAVAGEPLLLTVTALDVRGNVAKDYAGTVHFSSADPSDLLPGDGTFTAGVRTVSVAFVSAGSHAVTAGELGGSISVVSNTVTVQAAAASSIVVTATATVAGANSTVAAKVVDVFNNVVTSYAGTVHVTSSDTVAVLPADYTFVAATDNGQHSFAVTLKTAGVKSVTVADASAGFGGTASVLVTPAGAASCAILQLPASAAAGAQLGARVTVSDAFGNVASGYRGTPVVTSSDTAALISPSVAFQAADAGSRTVAVTLLTAGAQTITATDSGVFACTATVTVVPGATVLKLTLPANVNAGAPQAVTVRAQDAFGNAIVGYSQTVAFTSSDALAVKPANLAFTGTEPNSTATTTVTFNTVGSQSLTATQVGAPAVTGSATTSVHGFVYTNPNPNFGKVQLMVNAANSTASVVQLDLIATTATSATSGAAGRNGAYSAGMNLPLDPTRATADTTPLVEAISGVRVLNTGSTPKAVGAAFVTTSPTTAILYTGLSQKRAGAGAVTNDVSIVYGRTFYSVRLKLAAAAAVGTVFDGAALPATFRAAVRDRSVSDVITQADFALGKLEVK